MWRSGMVRVITVTGLLLALLVVGGPVASADPPAIGPFPAGYACPEFELKVAASGPDPVVREFTDRKGNLVRRLTAGKGYDLVFTNTSTSKSFSLKGNGFAIDERFGADSTKRVTATGHNVLILFPTDKPLDGEDVPSTVLYVGRVVYSVDKNEVWTMNKFSGVSTDICAKLSG